MPFGRNFGLLKISCLPRTVSPSKTRTPESSTSETMMTVPPVTETSTPEANTPETTMPERPMLEMVNAEMPVPTLPVDVALDWKMPNPNIRGVDSSYDETSEMQCFSPSLTVSSEKQIAERAAVDTKESGFDAFDCLINEHILAMRTEKLFNLNGADDENLRAQVFQAVDEDDAVSDAVEAPQAVVESYDIGVHSDSDTEDERNLFQQDDNVMR
ncbi:hypothetical protein PF005_g14047 [Phytophthora fragariae]|uniref:Uncharacterized protein n=2 Tax=Phytophthora fragariae TaxID=53985 RepID=A0A6A3EX99_9STRA|nr:hypothetical protein PF003_g12641 [Phytophthora fragariae]KAE8936986.1 hypothetical protein PF009_g13096 [Phytophthora fragariae]KAE9002219.1 hypothetical protein PF011_g13416 [Phytophthora fragariae]KAE9099809.1 hypothetical protein PF007_g15745 [Phytophthora fragariae]KAE9100202.1 hypothetical protein PF010_g14903 [Phytophthora fragariae]